MGPNTRSPRMPSPQTSAVAERRGRMGRRREKRLALMSNLGEVCPSRPRDLAHLMKPVAFRLCGDPNPAFSTESMLRFGPTGTLWVDLDTKQWGDYEDEEAGGNVLDLVGYRTGRMNG